jgi:oligopeptide transport system permease protein
MQIILYLLRKSVYWLCSLFVLATLTFTLMKAIPGDPFSQEQSLSLEAHEALMKHHGLNQTWMEQYQSYLASILRGDLGSSLRYQNRSVTQLIRDSFPTSALLGLQSLMIALSLSFCLGLICALKPDSWRDRLIQIFMALGISIPSFILATVLQYIFSIKLQWLPLARWGTFAQTILPSITLAALPTAYMTRLIRNNLLEVLQMDYIKMAKAKGLHPFTLLWRHALRNALLPVLSYLGPLTSALLVGSFIVESIYSIPGLGQWYVNSVANRDYPLIMGLTLFYSFILMSLIFIIDLVYGLVDPRIRLI